MFLMSSPSERSPFPLQKETMVRKWKEVEESLKEEVETSLHTHARAYIVCVNTFPCKIGGKYLNAIDRVKPLC